MQLGCPPPPPFLLTVERYANPVAITYYIIPLLILNSILFEGIDLNLTTAF